MLTALYNNPSNSKHFSCTKVAYKSHLKSQAIDDSVNKTTSVILTSEDPKKTMLSAGVSTNVNLSRYDCTGKIRDLRVNLHAGIKNSSHYNSLTYQTKN